MSGGGEREPRRWAFIDDGDGNRQRVQIVMHRGIPGFEARWTEDCNGCTEYGDYGSPKYGPNGCDECGYTGKRCRVEWLPLPAYQDEYFRAEHRWWNRRERRRRASR